MSTDPGDVASLDEVSYFFSPHCSDPQSPSHVVLPPPTESSTSRDEDSVDDFFLVQRLNAPAPRTKWTEDVPYSCDSGASESGAPSPPSLPPARRESDVPEVAPAATKPKKKATRLSKAEKKQLKKEKKIKKGKDAPKVQAKAKKSDPKLKRKLKGKNAPPPQDSDAEAKLAPPPLTSEVPAAEVPVCLHHGTEWCDRLKPHRASACHP